MKISREQLDHHLEKGLSAVYFISGDETLLVNEACDLVRLKAKASGFDERKLFHAETGFDWQSFLSASDNFSLFSEKTLIELRIPSGKPGDAGSKAIQAYINDTPEDSILLIISGKIERAATNSKWYKAIDKAGVTTQIWPIDLAQLPSWIDQRLKKFEMSATREGIQMMVDHVQGNLLAASQEVEKLHLLYQGQELTVEQISEAITDHARFDPFTLADNLLGTNMIFSYCLPCKCF